RPTISSTFSARAGSLERLKVRRRCGCRRLARQIRCTVCSARLTVLALGRRFQWVIWPGGSPKVTASTWLTVSIATGFLPGARVLSRSRPATPASAYRRCQRHTAGRLTPARPATCSTGRRSAESRTMRARCTCFTGRVRSPMIASKRTRSSSLTTTQSSWAIRPGYHTRRRCLFCFSQSTRGKRLAAAPQAVTQARSAASEAAKNLEQARHRHDELVLRQQKLENEIGAIREIYVRH